MGPEASKDRPAHQANRDSDDDDTPLHWIYAPNALLKAVVPYVRGGKQLNFVLSVHDQLTTLLTSNSSLAPESDLGTDADGAYLARTDTAFRLLEAVVKGIEYLGPMTEEYLTRLFSVGEQTLRFLELTIGKRYGGRVVDFAALELGHGNMSTTSQKDQRHLRRNVINSCLRTLDALAMGDSHRVSEAKDVVAMCAGTALEVRVAGNGTWNLPAINTNIKDKVKVKVKGRPRGKGKRRDSAEAEKEKWDAEMWYDCMCALRAAAQCLGHRYMRWEVEIRGQIVPGTGVVKGEVLEEWRAADHNGAVSLTCCSDEG
ncbi:hypothetical protein BAUCODRAFT_150966 [Baudoinia panamericana UAMH 10762]|uniref:Uncharacterized protein n=1 Tax=Baudoinia panamericana (strain UAMH 10762) TaxID=717646 RepID=M2MB36_BAUPA|nr:uncharacterized protein BAUCODRAFT_150966 [Baudoinia panamericana UAMH 10762]EMC93691.1 hypothetical protein BAUCODRAFT_150966 [Baudoinia panamericana UAMH 10762]